jgi:hypothetical protein
MAASSSRSTVVTNPAMSTTSAAITAGSTTPPVRYVANTTGQILYLRFGTAAATASDYTIQLAAGATWENPPNSYGPIQGLMATGSGNATVTAY